MRKGQQLPQGPVMVVGLARSGQAACRALLSAGLEVVAVDAAAPEGAAGLNGEGVELHLDDSGEELIGRVRSMVKSPGVPQSAPAVAAARGVGMPVIGELELGWRMTHGEVLAVTGTNGKTTSVEMIGHILRSAGEDSAVAGNVGTPLVSLAGTGDEGSTLAVEASSFQLEDTEAFAPDVAVFLNISPDHLDRHGSLQNYREAKMRIFTNQGAGSYAVIPSDMAGEGLPGEGTRVTFGGEGADLADVDGNLIWQGDHLMSKKDIPLPGAHNARNAQASAAACLLHGVPMNVVADALATFPGVPHRLETVWEANGVRWVNDSKATNVGATVTALASFEDPVHLILGGQGKGQDFSDLLAPVARSCVSVSLIGEAADEIGAVLDQAGVLIRHSGDLATAVEGIAGDVRPGEVVLLAPACASFDQFTDFESRGAKFRQLVGEVSP